MLPVLVPSPTLVWHARRYSAGFYKQRIIVRLWFSNSSLHQIEDWGQVAFVFVTYPLQLLVLSLVLLGEQVFALQNLALPCNVAMHASRC